MNSLKKSNSLLMFVCLFILLLVLSCNAENYYGLPIGTIENEEFGLYVDVFVANPHAIVMISNRKMIHMHDFKDVSLIVCQSNISTDMASQGQLGYTIEDKEIVCSSLVQSEFTVSQRWKRKVKKISEEDSKMSASSAWNIENTSQKSFSYEQKNLITSEAPETTGTEWSTIDKDGDSATVDRTKMKKLKTMKYKIKRKSRKEHRQTTDFSGLGRAVSVEAISKTAVNLLEQEKRNSTSLHTLENRSPHSSFNLISPIQEEAIVVLNTHRTLLQDFGWLGVWVQNDRKFYPMLSIESIEPPKEENIGFFKKNGGVEASAIILNCNTILVQNIHVSKDRKNSTEVSFHAGFGDVSVTTANSLRCAVLGFSGNVDLRKTEGSDLLILLPEGLRTFDIDYLYMYEHIENNFIASIVIPNLLVPPCD